MATFRFNPAVYANGVQMVPQVLSALFDFSDFSVSATSIRFFDDSDTFARFTGSRLTYSTFGGEVSGVAGGTITGFDSRLNGTPTIIVTGLSISAPGFANPLIAGNANAAWSVLLGKNDDIFGSAQADRLDGQGGNDRLFASGGADTVLGRAGHDTLIGGLGADDLTGGAGRDAFVFNTALGNTQRDTITDFRAVDDVIRLENAVFTAFRTLGTMVESRFQVGVAARDAGDRIIYDRADGVLSYDRDGRGGAAAVIFALVDPGTALGYQDIVII